tara:strand:- start:99 stop:515 length:417 start_codon:yes stop_codon:yes gene_type:complete
MEIRQVNSDCVDVFWNNVKNWIKRATDQSNGRHNLETTYEFLKKGNMDMFLIFDNNKLKAVYVTQKTIYPAKKVLSILFCGGSAVIKNVKKIERYFLNYAKKLNCSDLEIIGRRGWEKVIKNNKLKFKHTGSFYEVAT